MSQPIKWTKELLIEDLWRGNLNTKEEITDAIDHLIDELKKNMRFI